MKQPRVARCRSCNRPVYWAKTRGGKSMPVDAAPAPDGNIFLSVSKATGALSAIAIGPGTARPPGRNRYTSHFATCPNADEHRNG